MGRYTDRAQRIADEFGPGHHGKEALTAAIERVIREFVQHDMEWAALAVENHSRFRPLEDLAHQLRQRGQEE